MKYSATSILLLTTASLAALTASAAPAINLTSNTGATINFDGGMTIETTTDIGFNATGGGTVQVSNASTNTINSVSATALNVASTTIGASGMTFRSISSGNNTAAADPANGMVLNATGTSGGLTVTGDGSTTQGGNDTGGVIKNTTGDGVLLTNASSVTLGNMTIGDTSATPANSPDATANIAGDGVQVTNGSGLTLKSVTIARTGDHGVNASNHSNLTVEKSLVLNAGNGQEEHGLNLDEQLGANFVTDSLFDAFNETGLELINTSGSTEITISNTTFQDNKATVGNAGEEGILIEAQGSASIIALITGTSGDPASSGTQSIFDDLARQCVQAISLGPSSNIQLTVENSRLLETSAGDGMIIFNMDNAGSGSITVKNNQITDDTFGPYGALLKNDSSGLLDGIIQGNTATNVQLLSVNHDDIGSGGGANGTTRLLVGGAGAGEANTNTIGSDNIGIDIIATESGPVGSAPDVSLTILNNTVTVLDTPSFSYSPGIRVEAQNETRMNVDIRDNVSNSDPTCCGGEGLGLRTLDTAQIGIANLNGAAADTFLNGLNTFTGPYTLASGATANFVTGSPVLPAATTRPSP